MNANPFLVPVVLPSGETQWLPVAEEDTASYLIVFKTEGLLTRDPRDDRICVGGLSLAEAIGRVLMANPSLTYNDVLDHMEV